ncbi:hypothetical protein KM043_008017 [Ampulex compressa]|nr:hypothetical protein KM043_008017 [Ampulex compressa]
MLKRHTKLATTNKNSRFVDQCDNGDNSKIGSDSENLSESSRASRDATPVSHNPPSTATRSEDENDARSPGSNASGRSSRHSSVGSARSDKSGSQRSRSNSLKSIVSQSSDSPKSVRSRSPSPKENSPKSMQQADDKHSPGFNASPYDSPKSHRSGSPQSPRSNKSSSSMNRDSRARSISSASPKHTESLRRSIESKESEDEANGDRTEGSLKSDGEGSKDEATKGEMEDAESLKVADDNESVKSDTSDNEMEQRHKRENSGSGSESGRTTKRAKAMISSDSENERDAQGGKDRGLAPTADALFGDASDISTDDEKEKREEKEQREKDHSRSRSRSKSRSRSRSRSRSLSRGHSDSGGEGPSHQAVIEDDGDKEKEEEPEPPPETRIDVEIPKISTDLGREIHFVKLPNFLSVETRPFDHETYEDEIDEEETLDEEGRARLKLKVENTLRWKEIFDEEGKVVKESNARFIKWSDGSMSLHLGSEIFDVYKQPLQGDHNHLYIRQGTGLQGQAVFRTKLTFRPHSTESFTHRKMTMSLADRSQKTSGIKVLSQVGMNPDQNRYEMIKKEEEKLRMAMRVQSKTKKSGSSGRNSGRSAGGYGGDAYHDDGSDDEGAISLAAIKNKYKKGAAVPVKAASNIYSSDEEGSDFEALRPKKNTKGKVLKDSDEDSNSDSASESGRDGENQADHNSD